MEDRLLAKTILTLKGENPEIVKDKYENDEYVCVEISVLTVHPTTTRGGKTGFSFADVVGLHVELVSNVNLSPSPDMMAEALERAAEILTDHAAKLRNGDIVDGDEDDIPEEKFSKNKH